MRRRRVSCLAAAALLSAAAHAHAQDAMPGQPRATAALIGQVCAACHGVDGNSTRGDVPSLAGQIEPYLEGQLHAFAAQGEQRPNGVMGAIAVNLSADEMKRAAVYYARRQLSPPPLDEAPRAPRGETIYFAGVPGKGVASCAACHGVRGEGLPDLFPRLAGQHRAYLAEQLRHFRSGRRTSDPGAMMRDVAAHLSDRDVDAVAQYAARLR